MSKKENLEGFKWDDDVDFFGIEPSLKENDTDSPEKKDDALKGLKKASEEIEEENDYEEEEIEEEESSEKNNHRDTYKEEEEEEETDSFYNDLYADLRDEGIFKNVEIEEDEIIDAERFMDLHQEEINKEVDKRINAWATEQLDDDARAFIEFKRRGGKTQDFFNVYSSTSGKLSGDISDEVFQEKVIRYQLQQEGWEEDEIEDRIENLHYTDKLERVAQRYYKRIQEEQEEEKQELLEEEKRKQENALRQEEAFKNDIKTTLDNLNSIKGFPIKNKDREELYNFLTKRVHKTGNVMMTDFNKKLKEAFEDKEKVLLLAKLLHNNFDFSDFEKVVGSKKVRQVKSRLENKRDTGGSNRGSKSGTVDWFK